MFRIISSAVFLAAMAAAGFVGSRLLVSIAPWRETEIYLSAVVAYVGGLAVWFLVNRKPLIRPMLFAVAVLFLAGFAYGYYRTFISHYERDFPLIARFVDSDATGMEVEVTTLTPHDRLLFRVRNSQGFRARLLEFLNSPVKDEKVLTEADTIIASRYEYYAYGPAKLPHDLSWTEDPYDDRSWNWRLHNMAYVVTLARAYEMSGKPVYLQRAEELVLDWIHDNTRYIFDPPSEFSWNDHSTAFRLMNWLYFFDVWKESNLLSQEKIEAVIRGMLGHALHLADDNFYTYRHNHGIDQDRALLAFSLMHPYVRQATQWRDLALKRLREQIRFAVSSRGIHLEHSPTYHLYGMIQFQKTLAFLEEWRIRHPVVNELRQKTTLMAAFVPHLVKPDGFLAQVGDTGVKRITAYREQLAPLMRDSPILKELIETGRTRHLGNVALSFPEEGYAVIRDFAKGSLDFRESFYLFFSAGAHEGRGHRQADDLSFILSHGGRDLLTDPGYYSYKRDAGREYVVSAAAHNTVVVNGASYRGWDTRLDGFRTNERYTLIHASHRNYAGFEHERWLLYLRPELVFVIDRLLQVAAYHGVVEAAADHRFEQLFHFAPDLQVKIDATGRAVKVLHGNPGPRLVLRLVQLGEKSPRMRVVMGQEDPMLGWHSPEHGKLVPAPVLISRVDGESAQFITVLEMPNARKVGKVDQETATTERRFQAITENHTVSISWPEGGKTQILTLDLATDKVTLK